jgi:hypothetical protein
MTTRHAVYFSMPASVTESAGESSPADECGGKAEEGFVDVVADRPADAQAAASVQQRDGAVDDVAVARTWELSITARD